MDAISELQAGLRNEVSHHRTVIVRVGSLLAPANVVALELASALITEGVDVRISSRQIAVRKFLGARFASQGTERGAVLVVADAQEPATLVGRRPVRIAATPRLTAAGARHLARITGQLRDELVASKLRWTKYGRFLHPDQAKPDPDTLLRTNQLALALYSGQLSGVQPRQSLVRTFTDLQRRAMPKTSFVVWRTSGAG